MSLEGMNGSGAGQSGLISEEDLREFYITPAYLSLLADRIKGWTEDLISQQIVLFKKTIPDYPEVTEILEGELYRRELNVLKTKIRKMNSAELKTLHKKFSTRTDSAEIVKTELLIRQGQRILPES